MAKLYVISTPIGNLKDISQRALETLKEIDLVLCEDTRTTKKLLNYYQISKSAVSYHQHSRLNKVEFILKQLKDGKDLALVSDAGTPTISDPGAKLIDYLVGQMPDLKIIPIPGPSAVIAALSVSGFPADKFVFFGFPPIKNKRKKFFQEVAGAKYTAVFYESTHRILKTLGELKEILSPERKIVIGRELTKKFETIYRGSAEEIIRQLEQGEIRGEFVIMIERKK
ncbi:16S rRNA (cytidine(1402)-2'-O)-methyltransferase [Patescibacteria group bacterium]|nr:16S rRNA (cytidine(1402)-2'-O)-methyltransferase [Patescibacteria group bacterium]